MAKTPPKRKSKPATTNERAVSVFLPLARDGREQDRAQLEAKMESIRKTAADQNGMPDLSMGWAIRMLIEGRITNAAT